MGEPTTQEWILMIAGFGCRSPQWEMFITGRAINRSQAPSTRIRFQMKTQLYFCVLAYRLHENGKSLNENATF